MVVHKKKFKKKIEILVYAWLLLLNTFISAVNKEAHGLFHILMWTNGDRGPFNYWLDRSLILMNCVFQNCYFTSNKSYFLNTKDYDAILFNAPDVHSGMYLPPRRANHQIYVFVSMESESNYHVSKEYDFFFNYTWTYKLNSDIPLPYFYVRNKFNGKVIAPKMNVRWKIHDKMKPTPKSVIKRLHNKSICAAWFVSNCYANNRRLIYVHKLRKHLQKLGQQVDVFGNCDANKYCPRERIDDCFELVKANYYFYLSFENSFSEDYVTEKLMTAISNYAVPVVYGGANYSRFLPDGAYLNAIGYTPADLAIKMNDIIRNRQDYYEYFKFHRYYTYHTTGESEDIDPLCTFCEFINDGSVWKERRVYKLFNYWWHNKDSIPFIIPITSISDQITTNDPEDWDNLGKSDGGNFIIDFINHYFRSRK